MADFNLADPSPSADPRDGLADQLRQLEEFVTTTEASGDSLPAEAMEMVARLREIIAALDGLSVSLSQTGADATARPPHAELP